MIRLPTSVSLVLLEVLLKLTGLKIYASTSSIPVNTSLEEPNENDCHSSDASDPVACDRNNSGATAMPLECVEEFSHMDGETLRTNPTTTIIHLCTEDEFVHTHTTDRANDKSAGPEDNVVTTGRLRHTKSKETDVAPEPAVTTPHNNTAVVN